MGRKGLDSWRSTGESYQSGSAESRVKEQKVLNYVEYNRLAYMLTNPYRSRVAKVPWTAVRPNIKKVPDATSRMTAKYAKRVMGRYGLKLAALTASNEVQPYEESLTLEIWRRWNSKTTPTAARGFLFTNLALVGNVFLYLHEEKKGVLPELHAFAGYQVRTSGDGEYVELYRADQEKEPMFRLTQAEADKRLREIRIPSAMCLYSRTVGLGKSMAAGFELEEAASRTQAIRFDNNGAPGGLVELQGASDAECEMLTEEYNQQRAEDRSNALIFTRYATKITEFGGSIADLQLDETKEWNQKAGQAASNIPDEIFGISSGSNRATSYMSRRHFWDNIVEPVLAIVGEAITQWLVPLVVNTVDNSEPRDVIITYAGAGPDDREIQQKHLAVYPELASKNEHRGMMGFAPWGPDRGGDEPFVPAMRATPPQSDPDEDQADGEQEDLTDEQTEDPS